METALLISLISVVLLIVVSGFFSGSETGLTAVSRAKIHKLKIEGNKRALLVSKLRDNKDRLIGTILLGNNAVNILASAIATSVAIKYYGDEGVFFATIIMTTLILIFAEVMPKTYAFNNAEKVSLIIAPVMSVLVKILAPITHVVQVMVNLIMGNQSQNSESSDVAHSVEELRGAIELHHHEGGVVKRDKDMLGSILDLSETEVHEVMIHRKNMMTLDAGMPNGELVAKLLDSTHTRIPLWKEKPDNIVGLIHVKALLKILRDYKGDINDLDITQIISKPWFVPETTSLNDQLFRFRQRRNHMALVVNEYGDLVGLITLEDILEEIVGHIYDEFDKANHGIRRMPDGSYQVDGEVTIRDLKRALDWDFPDHDVATIAGYVIHQAETIPEVGQKFKFDGFVFKVLAKKRNQITSLNITDLSKGDNIQENNESDA